MHKHTRSRTKKMKNAIANIFIWLFVTRCLCIACSGRAIVFRRFLLFFFCSLRLRGGNICAIVSGVQNQSFHAHFFLLVELTSVGTCGAIWHKLECISYCTCWDCWANETTRPKRAYWAKLLIRHSLHNLSLEVRFFVLYRYHSIRFLVGAWLLFRSCGAARDKMASHVNQGSSAAGSNRQRINTDQPIQDIVARCRR